MTVDTDVGERLVRIETKIDRLLTDRLDHEVRIRSLEAHRWTFLGAATVLSVFASYLLKKVGL